MLTNDARPSGRTSARIRSFFGRFIPRAWRVATALVVATLLLPRVAAATAFEGAVTSEWLPPVNDAPGVLVYPPRGDRTKARPLTVMLHGMCAAPEHECPYFAGVVTRRSWLVCPRATLSCPGGGATWAASRRPETVEAAIARVVAEHPGEVDAENDRTLIGFSLGAFVAMDLANRAPSRWARVFLLAAKITPLPRALAQGSTRFVLGAGELDLSYAHMARATRGLDSAGVDASFLSLGRVGHHFADDMDRWLERAYALVD
jgi:predicted esterase